MDGSYNSERSLLRTQLEKKKYSVHQLKLVIEMEQHKIFQMERDLKLLENKEEKRRLAERSYLQPIGENGVLTVDQQKALKRTLSKKENMDTWRSKIEMIRNEHDRRVRFEVTYCGAEKKYFTKVFSKNHLSETWVLPAWNRNQIRCRIDHEKRPKVPWKQIIEGQPWVVDVELSPYYIEKTWVPKNVIPFSHPKAKNLIAY